MIPEAYNNIFFLKNKISWGMRIRDCMEGMRGIKEYYVSKKQTKQSGGFLYELTKRNKNAFLLHLD